jgi:uncharacterized membrane protein YhaH (DUF805 family)
MAAGPSRKLELFVGLLIPPACREEVLGDLCERYRSPGQYTADGVRVASLVTLSRIRRTTDAQVLLMEAMMLYLSFLSAAWFLDRRVLDDQWGLLRLAVPPVVAVVVLRLHDAWALPQKQSALRSVLAVVAGAGVACLCQIGSLPAGVNLLGGGLSLLLVSAVRVLFLPGTDLPQRAGAPGMRVRTAVLPTMPDYDSKRLRDIGVTVFLLVLMGIAIRYGSRSLIPSAIIFLSVAVYQINKFR